MTCARALSSGGHQQRLGGARCSADIGSVGDGPLLLIQRPACQPADLLPLIKVYPCQRCGEALWVRAGEHGPCLDRIHAVSMGRL
ncbi:unnamed protein product [Boreogadus saida]